MFRMVIADDEESTLQGIRSCLNWASYGIEISGQAKNGAQALELVRAIKPDILLTDIRMPKIDGTRLSKILKQEFPELKIIFITGYSEINYIKLAFKYDVIDYILKPVDPDELEFVISKTVEACKHERNEKEKRIELEAKIKQSMPLLQEKFYRQLISDELKDRNDLLRKMDFLGVNLPKNGFYTVLAVYIDDYYFLQEKYSMHEKQLLTFSMVNIISKAINDFTRGLAFEYNENEFIGIIGFDRNTEECSIEEKIEIIANDIKGKINSDLKISITIGIGKCVDRIERIPFSYQRAMFAANQKFYLGKNKIIYVDITKNENDAEIPINNKDAENIYIALRLGNYERVEAITNGIFNKLINKENLKKQYIHGVCLYLISIASRAATEFYDNFSERQINIYHLVDFIFKLETLEDLKSFILSTFKKLCNDICRFQRNSSKKVVEDIKSIIYEKYDEDISINYIAKAVYLTPSYICLLFKQEIGMTINDFLTMVRIEKAKELISGKMTKLYEVSKKVGYNDPKYFSKIFKKYTGVKPSEYNK